jgi:hypothetical protein
MQGSSDTFPSRPAGVHTPTRGVCMTFGILPLVSWQHGMRTPCTFMRVERVKTLFRIPSVLLDKLL